MPFAPSGAASRTTWFPVAVHTGAPVSYQSADARVVASVEASVTSCRTLTARCGSMRYLRGARRSVGHGTQGLEQPLGARNLRGVSGIGADVRIDDMPVLADREDRAAAVALVALQHVVRRH